MKIQTSNVTQTSPLIPNSGNGTAESGNRTAVSSSDAVHLTSLGSALSAASTGMFSNQSRIETLSNIVRSGSYSVDPLQISRNIINDALTA